MKRLRSRRAVQSGRQADGGPVIRSTAPQPDQQLEQQLEQQLGTHLRNRAEHMRPHDPGVLVIMEQGSNRARTHQRWKIGGGVAAASLIIAGIVLLSTRRSTPSIAKDGSAAASQTQTGVAEQVISVDEITPAHQIDPQFEWTLQDGDSKTTPGWGGSQTLSPIDSYLIATLPGRGQNFGKQVVYHTTDGIEWTTAADTPLKDLWLSDVQGAADGVVYGIGTAPGAKRNEVDLVGAVSSDRGATFESGALAIDFNTIRKEIGGQAAVSQLASNGTNTVAALSGYLGVDPQTLAPKGIDSSNGVNLGTGELQIYGPPSDLKQVAKTVCPPGWDLQKGPPTFSVQTSETGPAGGAIAVPATMAAVGGPGGQGEWHCSDPAQKSDDVYVDGSQIHGPVEKSIPFDQLGLSDDSVKVLRQQPRIFVTTDGKTWTESSLPDDAAGYVSSFTGTERGYTLLLQRYDNVTSAGTQRLLTSPDGITWSDATTPHGFTMQQPLSNGPDGQLIAIGSMGSKLVVVRSADGQNWTVNSLDSLLGADKSIRSYVERVLGGPSGIAAVVQAYRDPLAAKGGATLEHGDLTLHIEDTRNSLRLADRSGAVLDTFDGNSGTSANGMLRQGINGVNVVRSDDAQVLTTFTWQEIQNTISSVVSEDEMNRQQFPQRYLLASADGENWSAERFDQIGLIGSQNISSASGFVDDKSIAMTFIVNVCCDPNADPVPPVVLIGTPIK